MTRILHADCLVELARLHAAGEQFDACVTDPPYHLTSIVKRFGSTTAAPAQFGTDGAFARASRGFMGKTWDGGDVALQPETWRLVLDVLKPGAHLLAFGGTRTFHRLVCAIEDAGFEVRDTILWVTGQGFPKSHDISKAIDREAGAVRKIVGNTSDVSGRTIGRGTSNGYHGDIVSGNCRDITAAATPEATQWSGWGTALKPAVEMICVARKPLEGTVAANVLRHGTGGLNIAACRVEGTPEATRATGRDGEATATKRYTNAGSTDFAATPGPRGGSSLGRWPANLVHDGSDEVLALFPQSASPQPYVRHSGSNTRGSKEIYGGYQSRDGAINATFGDSGSAARFFYCAKADASDRAGSKHPTVKPLALMRWLVRLVTPPGGTVLDPFAGSGTTGEAAAKEGSHATLIEREAQYIADIHRRMGRAHGADTPLFALDPPCPAS